MKDHSAIENQSRRRRVERRVCALVAANLCLDPEQVSLASSFKVLGADTLDFYSIMMDLETASGIPILDYEARQFVTVGDAVAHLWAQERLSSLTSIFPTRSSLALIEERAGKGIEIGGFYSTGAKLLSWEEVERQVIKTISSHLCIETRNVSLDSSFQDLLAQSRKDLGADFFDIYSMMIDLEEAFGVSIPDQEAEKFVTVADAVEFILAQARRRSQLSLAPGRQPQPEIGLNE